MELVDDSPRAVSCWSPVACDKVPCSYRSLSSSIPTQPWDRIAPPCLSLLPIFQRRAVVANESDSKDGEDRDFPPEVAVRGQRVE